MVVTNFLVWESFAFATILVGQITKFLQSSRKTTVPWKRKWQPTPIFLAGKSLGQRSLASYSPWGRKRDTTERTSTYIQRQMLFSVLQILAPCECAKSLKLCLTLSNPMDCSLPGSRDFPGKNIWVDCHFLQEIFPTQESNPGLLHCRHILYGLKLVFLKADCLLTLWLLPRGSCVKCL